MQRLIDDGLAVRVASRRPVPSSTGPFEWATVDYRDGGGVSAAFEGVDAVVHCATSYIGGEAALARTVIDAARKADVRHLVYISIVGTDRVPMPYYRAKLAAEREFTDSGLPVTVQRATQFHDLVAKVLDKASVPPILPLPAKLPFQPIDVGEVGERLARVVVDDPGGRAPDIGGPSVRGLRELAESYLATVGKRRRIVEFPLRGKTYSAMRTGGLLAPEHAEGVRTFEEYLRGRAD